MAAVCEVCGKHPSFGMSISHSHRRTKRRWNPNIQRVRAIVNGSPKRLHVCTSCIRAGKVTKQSHNNMWVSLLNLFGLPNTKFGHQDYCTGPLAGLV